MTERGAEVRLETTYVVDAADLWRDAVRFDSLAADATGALQFGDLPAGELRERQELIVPVRVWGVVPVLRWRIRILRRDDAARVIRSTESGGAVTRWDHTIFVESLGPGRALWTDLVDIEAGVWTGLMARHAERLYVRRHSRRQERLHRALATRPAFGA